MNPDPSSPQPTEPTPPMVSTSDFPYADPAPVPIQSQSPPVQPADPTYAPSIVTPQIKQPQAPAPTYQPTAPPTTSSQPQQPPLQAMRPVSLPIGSDSMQLNLSAMRVRRARLGIKIGKRGELMFWITMMLFGVGLAYFAATKGLDRFTFISAAVTLVSFMLAAWQRYDLSDPKPNKQGKDLDDNITPSLLGVLEAPLSPRSAWLTAMKTREGVFLTYRLLIQSSEVASLLSDQPADMAPVWEAAEKLRARDVNLQLHGGMLALALITTSQTVINYLAQHNLRVEDVQEIYAWLDRLLDYTTRPKPYFGGIGRDWATGFTPTLERFSTNISQIIEYGRGHFHYLAQAGLSDAIVHDLSQGAGGVAIVGPTGAGKTELVHGLAERLLLGHDQNLKHYQVISLNASLILSSEKNDLERLMLTLFHEAIQAGNVILFLDEAQLFFGEGVGAFNMAQVLLPVLQARRLKIVAAFTPNDFQRLKVRHESLANSFSVVTLNEPTEVDTLKVVEDSALSLEARTGNLVTYSAVREAYRLSGQYMSDLAYPGKAITLLDQSAAYATNKVMTAASVQMAIEKTMGIKAGAAGAAEADVLLNLEAKIHERMINQVQAVNAISAALRRVRAGVTNPSRPAGSFLFLGPTGVGKTELARSLAAAYYGDSHNMIRLDMSEYQQASDVSRLLADGADSSQSLIMSIRKQPFSVVLLDEIEKAHPNILNLMLQLLDEGQLTDQNGRVASFRSAIIITTSNAGSQDIIQKIAAGQNLGDFERPLIDKLIASGQFRPELINRFDEVVLFRPLNQEELTEVAKLMISEVNRNLSKQNITVNITDEALAVIAKAGYDPQFGARPMRHIIQKTVEDVVATRILQGSVTPGSVMTLGLEDVKLPQSHHEPTVPAPPTDP
jgi:ATP-dependent Clp protease ATP-binding subunit ClpC